MEQKNLETNEHNFSPLTKGPRTQKGISTFLPISAADTVAIHMKTSVTWASHSTVNKK